MATSDLAKAFDESLHPRAEDGRFATRLASRVNDYLSLHSGEKRIDKAMNRYVDGGNGELNGYLRSGGSGDERLDEMASAMDDAIEKLGTPAHGVLYRGVDLGHAPHLKQTLTRGGTFSDASFTSTTGNLEIARNFATRHVDTREPAVLAIHPEQGTKTLKYDKLDEGEEILPRGGTFKVTGAAPETRFGKTVTRFEVEWRHGQ